MIASQKLLSQLQSRIAKRCAALRVLEKLQKETKEALRRCNPMLQTGEQRYALAERLYRIRESLRTGREGQTLDKRLMAALVEGNRYSSDVVRCRMSRWHFDAR